MAVAAPHVPASDDEVLERVPAAAATQRLTPLRQRLAANPHDRATALELARGYLEIGRRESDPRFISYAEATLQPWVATAQTSPDALILQATALQYLHHFDAALTLLDQALARAPNNGQAWLTRADILQVQGRFDDARTSCRALARTTNQLVTLSCLTGVGSLTGRLDVSYRALRVVYVDDERLPKDLRLSILNELADMAERSGDYAAAEQNLRIALQISPEDPYSRAAYADLLLHERRDAEVLTLLRGSEAQDNLLLRMAIAATRVHAADAQHLASLYQARYEAARRDGDFTHLREQARFLLEVRGDSAAALALAQRNWEQQREPADVRVWSEAAQAAHDAGSLAVLQHWIQDTGYEDSWLPRQTTPASSK